MYFNSPLDIHEMTKDNTNSKKSPIFGMVKRNNTMS